MAKHTITISDKKPKNSKLQEMMRKRHASAEGEKLRKGLRPPFQPGQSGNPNGRPKGSGSKKISEAYSAYLEQQIPEEDCEKLGIDPAAKITWSDMIAIQTMRRSLGLVESSKISFEAITELREVTEGKIPDRQEVSGKNGAPLSAQPPIINVKFKEWPPKDGAKEEQPNVDDSTASV